MPCKSGKCGFNHSMLMIRHNAFISKMKHNAKKMNNTTKESAIKTSKSFRERLDDILQEMKARKLDIISGLNTSDCLDKIEVVAQHQISIRALEDSILRQGMVCKYIGNPCPYPESKLTPMQLAQNLYETYCESTGWQCAVTGDSLPEWEELKADASKEKVIHGWVAAAMTHPALLHIAPTADGLKL